MSEAQRTGEDHRDALLVIGAGPSGLAVAGALKRAGVAYVQVEATDHVGGNWAHGVYETAHIISSRRTTEYSDYPMPSDWPDFPSAAQMKAYYEDYARSQDLYPGIRFETRVERVEPDGPRTWLARFSDGSAARFKGVVICNGHHWARELPPWADDFEGDLLHSKDYKRPAQLQGRRVLVIGGGNSGCDIISEAARVGLTADWSLRRGYWFMPKTLFGRPSVEIMPGWLPVPLQRVALRVMLRIAVGDYREYGLPTPDHRIFEAHPSVSTEALHYLKHGRIQPRPDVVSVEGRRVRFADGAEAEYDAIVCATGYAVALPMLPEGMVPVIGKTPQLLGGMLRPDLRHLYVFGTFQARYGIGPLVTPAAELLAEWAGLQDELDVPLGAVLEAMGERPPTSHLMDPHVALRRMRVARRALPLLRWRGQRMSRGAVSAASSATSNPAEART